MSAPCSAAFRALAEKLGGIPCDPDPVASLRSPADLANWTLPVIEILMIGGAVLALAHAARHRRRTGNPAYLALWFAPIVYALVIEPPLYFPEQFGIDDRIDLIFVHNVFTVQFMFDRLPLYILAVYVAVPYLACALVDRVGVFDRRGRLVGAICVGFVHQCFYEIFDHIGPQLRWWAWNPDAATNEPALGSVPLSSTVIFGLVGPAILAFLWRALIAEPAGRRTLGSPGLVGRVVAVGVLTPVLLPVAGAPLGYLTTAEHPNHALMAAVFGVMLAAAAAVALPALAPARRRPPPAAPVSPEVPAAEDPAEPATPAAPADRFVNGYAVLYGTIYLAVFVVLWLTALPDLLSAHEGVTDDGTPIGNPYYALGCAAVCVWVVALAARNTRGAMSAPTTENVRELHELREEEQEVAGNGQS
ncbi:hypothetical protein Ga0074812_1179 [Parafrankia irregularis]|uniref:DUF7802 domain-containing protein n=1 Tax=Parafrankia irregularis TaxID=795642 RepID=A0A0S4QS28_9ACTN|nr:MULTISPECIES: hypothetical protein [Parafrankia]MBE3205951.1 hypothetical protein [Parafrankia sp. CH37]CUU58100.1 hypothetical protein Ga0074812_1179 [Parafrankia irregularis]